MAGNEYTVPGVFDVMAQPTNMTCWATVGAMMMNWRQQVCRSIASAMAQAGSPWDGMFTRGEGLIASQHQGFASACGMRVEPLMCYPLSTWLANMRRYGPLAVVTANPYHARILVGVTERGNPRQTYFRVVDPNGGRRYDLEFGAFTRDFEAVAQSPRFQLWHY
ncbi:MAG: hypothetical protein HY822_23035 [Acidobacteria bacterium]|nr:hypothetical protein [Acidobacteriota bacterium]